MYNQLPNSVSSAAKWIFIGGCSIVLMAILLGTNIQNATWLNPNIANAEAERIQIESAHQQATYELQERLSAAQTEAEIQAIQREQKRLDAQFNYDMQRLTQDLINRQNWTDAMINLTIFVGGALAIAASIGGIIFAIAKAIAILRSAPKNPLAAPKVSILPEIQIVHPAPERIPYEPWHNEEYRRAKIKEARYREREARKAELSKDRNNLPLAG